MTYKIVLIGGGNIGSRHLQALKKTARDISITVCEPSKEARDTALARYNEVPENEHIKGITFTEDYRTLDTEQDIVIVATSSGVRYEITKWVLENLTVKVIVLEKVVFQQMEQFCTIGNMIREKGVKVYANCSRRIFGCYEYLKKLFKDEERVDMAISGDGWGMGCNSIHFLDLYAYLTGFKTYRHDISGLRPELIDSKRAGYKEFLGKFRIMTDRGDALICCDVNEPSFLKFDTSHFVVDVDEAGHKMQIYDKVKQTRSEKDMDVLFTSDVTNRVAEQLIDTGDCKLVKYEETAFLHKIILEAFLEHMNKFTDTEVKLCPIT